jgi:hypothetical protein
MMTSYVVAGHPLGYVQGASAAEAQMIYDQLQTVGVGGTITLTLSGPTDAAAKNAEVLQ